MTKLTVAALQLAFGEDTDANIGAVAELVREAHGRGAQARDCRVERRQQGRGQRLRVALPQCDDAGAERDERAEQAEHRRELRQHLAELDDLIIAILLGVKQAQRQRLAHGGGKVGVARQLGQRGLLAAQQLALRDRRGKVVRCAQTLHQLWQRGLEAAALGAVFGDDPAGQRRCKQQKQDQHHDDGHLQRGRYRAEHVMDAEGGLSRCGRHGFSLPDALS